jgi:hypothetical protein
VVKEDSDLPFPSEDIIKVVDAKHTFVAWKKEFAIICVGQENEVE